MDNVLQTNGVPLTVFGGAVPELAPEDLPEGASPFNQDCDFNPGSVFTRGGRQNQYTFLNQVITANPQTGKTLPGAFAPNEVPWTTPTNITLNTPGTYASVPLNQGVNISSIIQYNQLMFNTLTQSFTASFNSPVTAGNTVLLFFFTYDPSGSTEGVNLVLAGVTDNKSQAMTRLLQSTSHASQNFASFVIVQASAVGGNQTYTFNPTKTAGGVISASRYAVTMVEITGTANAGGADPTDQIQASDMGIATTQVNLNPATNNELFIAAMQQNIQNQAMGPSVTTTNWFYTLPGAYWHNANLAPFFQMISNIIANPFPPFASFQWMEAALLGKFLPNSGNPNSIQTVVNWGPIAAETAMTPWITLKMTNTFGCGQQGILPVGADASASSTSGGARTLNFTLPTVTTNLPNEFVWWFVQVYGNANEPTPIPPNPGGAILTIMSALFMYGVFMPTPGSVTLPTLTGGQGASVGWFACAFSIPIIGNAPPWFMNDTNNSGNIPVPTYTATFSHAPVKGSSILVIIAGVNNNPSFNDIPNITGVTNSAGDVFTQVAFVQGIDTISTNTQTVSIWLAQNIVGGNTDLVVHNGALSAGGGSICGFEIAGGIQPIQPTPQSQILAGAGYANIPQTDSVLGMQVIISGHHTAVGSPVTLSVSLNQPGSQTIQITTLPASDGSITVATPFTQWLPNGLTAPMVSSRSFGINIVASQNPLVQDTIDIYAVQEKLYVSPNPPSNFNWVKTYEQTDAETDTLALDAAGFLWDEDVDTNPTVLNSIFNTILPNTFAKSVTFNDIEYIALSNLLNGTDVPRQWNGQFLDRISMVGPGAACSASVSGGSGGSNSTKIQQITQAAPVQIRRIAWGASINAQSDSTPGNVLVISLPGGSTHGGNPPLNMNIGDTIQLQSITVPFPLKGGGSLPYNLNTAGPLNGYYTLLSTGAPIIGGGETDTAFTLQAPAVQYGYSNDFGVPPTSGWTYQDTVATIQLQAPLPNVNVNSQITITGTGTPYDGTWTVLTAPNASSMTITTAILVGTVATYTYNLAVGSAQPQALQLVSVANCLNGTSSNDPNIFNFTNKQIQSVSPSGTSGSFTVNLSGPDVTPAQPQSGNQPPATASVAGTKFTFDPQQIINSGNPVTSGTIVTAGQVATGVRKVCYSFLTRSGYITQPSPLSTFNVTSGSGSLTVSGLSPGPSNVVARIVFFTGANGANFFYIPTTQYVTVPGQPAQKNDSTIIANNRDTQATFSFSDAVLLSATAIDIPGNNLFNTIELGSCRGLLTYASRMFAWSEQMKVTNFRNLSFDGGYSDQNGTNIPLGWQIDPTNGGGASLSLGSSVFGWSFFINNNTVSTQTTWGMITQGAYQDEFGVAIIQANTAYSVRICALCQPQPQSGGNLVVDLFSNNRNAILGSFSIPLASMTTTMQIYTGTLLLQQNVLTAPVPSDLVLRIYATNIPAGAQILVDRLEPFQTLVPVNTTALKGSYANNQEAFDLQTGVCGPAQNMQPINGAMVLFDLLYALKERSWFSTFDNGVTEPFKWNWKEVSNRAGAVGIHAYDHGEGWALAGNREGVFFFEGGEPIKVSQEIQPVWDAINWQYGYTIWVRNDPEQRRFTVGIPIATPNQWMPEFPTNTNPTSPNVILMCNYRELNTGAAIAQTGPIRSTYMGRLMSPEPARKWSFWNIACPYSDYISRNNNNWPQFFCTGYQDSKIFALQASQLSDDGNAINSFWISYGFVKPEMADAKGLGLFRMEFPYFTVLAVGSGTLNTYVYPESPFNVPYALDPLTLPALSQGDLEIGVNIKGNRFFVRVGTNAVGAAFRCSKMVVPLIPDTWAPVRGYNVITA